MVSSIRVIAWADELIFQVVEDFDGQSRVIETFDNPDDACAFLCELEEEANWIAQTEPYSDDGVADDGDDYADCWDEAYDEEAEYIRWVDAVDDELDAAAYETCWDDQPDDVNEGESPSYIAAGWYSRTEEGKAVNHSMSMLVRLVDPAVPGDEDYVLVHPGQQNEELPF